MSTNDEKIPVPGEDHTYDDIINLPYRKSSARPQMSLHDRAAQFMPFAALTGYDDSVREAARTTEGEVVLDDGIKEEINAQLFDAYENQHEIAVTYFVHDVRKEGGTYETRTGVIKRIDEIERQLIFWDKTGVPIDGITEVRVVED